MVFIATFRIELSSTTTSRLKISTVRIPQRRRCTASGIRRSTPAGVRDVVAMRTTLPLFTIRLRLVS